MGLIIPSRQQVVGALQAYVRAALPQLDPTTERRSYIGGKVKSLGSALHDWYVALKKYGDNEPFPQTASRDFLMYGWWRDVTHLDPNPAAPAKGKVVITGTAGAVLDSGEALSANQTTYTVDHAVAIVTQSLNIASLTRTGSTAIIETAEPHYLGTGMTVTISGATQTDYNGAFQITVTAANEFTYDLGTLTPASPATGSPILTGTWGVAEITASVDGQAGNLDNGAAVSIANGPDDVDAVATVTFGGIAGGTEAESVESYRARILESLGTDFGMFSEAEIKIVAKTVPGVTRVWVRKASLFGTNGVNEGQVKIAFMRDGDANPFPSAQEVATVKAKIVSTIMPAHTAEEDVMVYSPTPLAVDFQVVSLSPDTASMRKALKASLVQFFEEGVHFGETIPEDAYRCAIHDTYDREGRAKLKSFTLSTPTGDIAVGADELPRLGAITFL